MDWRTESHRWAHILGPLQRPRKYNRGVRPSHGPDCNIDYLSSSSWLNCPLVLVSLFYIEFLPMEWKKPTRRLSDLLPDSTHVIDKSIQHRSPISPPWKVSGVNNDSVFPFLFTWVRHKDAGPYFKNGHKLTLGVHYIIWDKRNICAHFQNQFK